MQPKSATLKQRYPGLAPGESTWFDWQVVASVLLITLAASGVGGQVGMAASTVTLGLIAVLGLFGPEKMAFFVLSVGILCGGVLGKMLFGGTMHLSDAPIKFETAFAALALLRLAVTRPATRGGSTPGLVWVLVLFALVDMWVFYSSYKSGQIIESRYRSYVAMLGRFAAFCWLCLRAGRALTTDEAVKYLGLMGLSQVLLAMAYLLGSSLTPIETEHDLAIARISSLSGDPNGVGVACAMGLVLALPLIYKKWLRWVAVPFMALLALALLRTASRTSMLAAGAAFLFFFLAGGRKHIVAVIFIAVGVVVAWAYGISDVHRDRLLEVNYSTSTRKDPLMDGIRVFLSKPLTGGGRLYYQFEDTESGLGAHNSIVQSAAEGGLPFLLAHLICLALLAYTSWLYWVRGPRDTLSGYIAAAFGYLIAIQGLSMVVFHGAGAAYLIYGGGLLLWNTSRNGAVVAAAAKPRSRRIRKVVQPAPVPPDGGPAVPHWQR